MTVCGPRTQHDRHQAVFLSAPLFTISLYRTFLSFSFAEYFPNKSYPQFIHKKTNQ